MKHTATATTQPTAHHTDKLLPEREVRQRAGEISRTTRWRWQQEQGFPRPVTIGRRSLWSEREITAWIAGRLARRA